MKPKFIFAFIVMVAVGVLSLFSCKKDLMIGCEYRSFYFDKQTLTLEATSSYEVVKILGTVKMEDYGEDKKIMEIEDWSGRIWGISSLSFINCEGDGVGYANDFVVETNGMDYYDVHTNPFVGDFFSIERKGNEIHLRFNENNDDCEKKMTIHVNGGTYIGDIIVTQKGKSETQ